MKRGDREADPADVTVPGGPGTGPTVFVLPSAESVAGLAAQQLARRAQEARADGRALRIALPGGTTPERLYRLLATPEWRSRIDWDGVAIHFADERAVPPDHADSNYRFVRETLLAPLGIAGSRVHRMRGEEPDLEAAAREYEAFLAEPLDLVLLGIGPEGHVASLFPGGTAAHESVRRVVPVLDSPKPPARRITVTPRVLREARHVIVLAIGTGKSDAVARALDSDTSPRDVPARWVRDRWWLLDLSASAAITGG